jgi:hypothetical protein
MGAFSSSVAVVSPSPSTHQVFFFYCIKKSREPFKKKAIAQNFSGLPGARPLSLYSTHFTVQVLISFGSLPLRLLSPVFPSAPSAPFALLPMTY